VDIKIVIGLLFGGILSAFAQQDSLSKPHFKSYKEKVIFSIYYSDISNSFDVKLANSSEADYLEFKPNKREQIGVNLSYRFIDFSIGYSPSFLETNKDNENSKLFRLNTRLYYKKWMQSILFINQTGFYVSQGDIVLYFEDLRTTKIGGTTSYIFNDNFSFRTISNQKEWQSKSAGSFIPNFSFYYTHFDLNDEGDANKSDIFLISLSPSYFYNWVINDHFLLSGGLAAGGGIDIVDSDVSPIFEWGASLKLGYNSDSFFTFINLNYIDFLQNSDAKIRVNDEISMLKFTTGYRFKPPKKVKEYYDKADKKIGL
jgi:hypothetical protein